MNLPNEIAANYINIAKGKVGQKWYKTLVLAVLAGAFISFGAALATVAGSGFAGIEGTLIKAAVFPLGLILVVVCGAELFTGNCLLFAPLVNGDIKITGALKSWGIVYAGNVIGSVLIALVVVYGHSNGAAVMSACVNTAAAKCNLPFADSFLRGIACNILVCLAVWASMASKNVSGKVLAVYLPVFAFVACGFEHCVANMYYLTAGLLTSASGGIVAEGLTFGNSLLSLLSSTIGNIIGGALIAVAYWLVYLQGGKLKSVNSENSEK